MIKKPELIPNMRRKENHSDVTFFQELSKKALQWEEQSLKRHMTHDRMHQLRGTSQGQEERKIVHTNRSAGDRSDDQENRKKSITVAHVTKEDICNSYIQASAECDFGKTLVLVDGQPNASQ
jgi:hypothetical protein